VKSGEGWSFPCQRRMWRLLSPRDRALLQGWFQYGLSWRTLSALTGISRRVLRRRVQRLLKTLRDPGVLRASRRAKGRDLYLLKLHYFYGLSVRRIAEYSGLSGDRGGRTPRAIARRLGRLMRKEHGRG